MNVLRGRGLVTLVKTYVAVALAGAVAVSPAALSVVPLLALAWHLYSWWRPFRPRVELLSSYFMFFAVAVLLAPAAGAIVTTAAALPIILLVNRNLQAAAALQSFEETARARRPTAMGQAMLIIPLMLALVAALVGSAPLLSASVTALVGLVILGVVAVRGMPLPPVHAIPAAPRMLAGGTATVEIGLEGRSIPGGRLLLRPRHDWVRVKTPVLSLDQKDLAVALTVSPRLAGPSVVTLEAFAADRWGLVQVRFELEVARLHVIPRARYAAWLVKKYLAGGKPGSLPLVSNVGVFKPLQGLRRGVEYYGSQLYQPGDSLKSIDWKHSLKYNRLITREFAEWQGRSAILLVNLATADADEADRLATRLMMSALSLAQENIPAALAVYDESSVKLATKTLSPRELLVQVLRVSRDIVTVPNPRRFLASPDLARLRANIRRLRSAEGQAASILGELLRLESRNLVRAAARHPATRAVLAARAKAGSQCNVVVVSCANHDAAALAVNTADLVRSGHGVVAV